jgi:Family of unknown function (DUF6481)
MSNRSEPNLEERLKHASEAKKLMLAKFKTSLVEGPATIEKRQQRQAIAAARAERAVQREEARQRQELELAKQAEIAAQAAADAARAAADEAAREAAEQAERNALLEAEQKATRYAARKAAKKKRGAATKPKARRIAANIAKLPDLLKTPQYWATRLPCKWVRFGSASYAQAGRFTRPRLPGYLRQSDARHFD